MSELGIALSMTEFDTHSTLIERVRDPDDGDSWREFVELYEPLLLRFVLSQGTPMTEAHDIVQEVFTNLLKAIPNFRLDHSRGRFRSWLWNVSRNVVIDWARRRNRRKSAETEWQTRLADLKDDEDSRAAWCIAHRKRVLEFALTRVRTATEPRTWASFEEHLWKGRRAAAVAEELGITSNSVYVNASRVLKRVRAVCEEFGETLDDD
jgi:RNA polymerase sigma-70 factor (ECF subfamily)